MLDNTNPTSQFHPYTRTDMTPHSELPPRGLKALLAKAGIDSDKFGSFGGWIRRFDLHRSIEKARGVARSKPAIALGALAVVAIGLGLLRRRA